MNTLQATHGSLATAGPKSALEWDLLSPSAKSFAFRTAVIASTGGLLFGYDIGVVEGALPQLGDELHLSDAQEDLIVSMMVVGAIAGSPYFISGSRATFLQT